MKYTFFTFALLTACHGFAMQQQQSQTPAPTATTPLIQKPRTTSSSVIIALANGAAPTNLFKKILYERILGQQQ